MPRMVGELGLAGAVGVHHVDLVIAVRRLTKAILVPSGDQSGSKSNAGLVVSCVTPVPSAFITYTS